MLFKYKGIDKLGKKAKGTMDANSLEEAKAKLKSNGIYYEKLEESRKLSIEEFSKQYMPSPLLSSFAKELSSYLNSGMAMLTAMKLLENQHSDHKKYRSFLNSLKTMIDEGKSLYTALTTQKVYALPDFFTQSVNVASTSGKLSGVLTNMGNFFSAQSKVTKQIKGAMAYPLFILSFALIMSGVLITFVVPKITSIFDDMGQELPEITQFILAISDFLKGNYITLFVGLILFVVVYKFAYRHTKGFRMMVDRIMIRLPLIGTIVQNYELGRFSYILSLMLSSGVSYAQAVQLASTTFNNVALKDLFDQSSQRVLEGNKLSNALSMTKGTKLKRNFMQSLALGEESSEVAHILDNVAKLYNEENEDKIKLMLSLLEPIMMLFIAGIVGLIVVAMLLPIFSMNLGAGM
ncbi:MAG: secretion system protein F [Sulfurovum sp. PC08-66]|jgi:general secretion pathway protein F/type IV pilus assembly protein PilC|nr:MAG: secretion system protein F [Sulfurovum sp. PC08-66]